VDRVISLKISDPKKINPVRSTEQVVDKVTNIELMVSKPARNFVEENRGVIENVIEGEDLHVTLHPIDIDWLSRTILGYGSAIRVIEPSELTENLTARAKAIRKLYQNSK
jgi:predicted DNA-binding transcriptional regulator YafY